MRSTLLLLLLTHSVTPDGEAEGGAEAESDPFTNGHRQTLGSSDQDLTALLREASSEDLLRLRDQAEALRRERFEQHESLLRQLERGSPRPASPSPPSTPPSSLLLGNQLARDLFLNTGGLQPGQPDLEVQPIFSIPEAEVGQAGLLSPRMIELFEAIENRNSGVEGRKTFSGDSFRFKFSDADIRVTEEESVPALDDFKISFKESPVKPRLSTRRPENVGTTFRTAQVESDDFRLSKKPTPELRLSDLFPAARPSATAQERRVPSPLTTSTTPPSLQTGGQFPNFPTSLPSPGGEQTTRRGIKRPPKPRIRKINREEIEDGETEKERRRQEAGDEDIEKERRRQEAGLKRRKELFEAARKRKLLDSKKRRLFERKRVEKPPTTVSTTRAPSSTTITTRETSPSAVTTGGRSVPVSSTELYSSELAATQERKETQERIVDSALRAVLGRAVKGEVQDDPLVWAAVGAIYEFVKMQERTESEQVPTEILSALGQLTEFLNRDDNLDREQREEMVRESLNVDTVTSFNKQRLAQRKSSTTTTTTTTTTRAPLDDFQDDFYYEDSLFYSDESLSSNDYLQYETEEDQFRFGFSTHQLRLSPSSTTQSVPERTVTPSPGKETTTVFLDTPFRLQFDPKSGLYSTVLND